MKRFLTTLTFVALFSMCLPLSMAADLGDPAGPLDIATWVKGQPVDLAKTKGSKIVVVEFWATWCGPCRVSIPHLTEVAKKFASKDVLIVGVSDEEVSKVKPFVEKMGDKMDYVVAVDRDNKTGDAYMKAYGINGIPHAFVVDKQNRIVWQGHPMAGLDAALEKIVAGTYDLALEKKRAGAQQKLQEYSRLAMTDGSAARMEELGNELTALDAELGGIQSGRKLDLQRIRNNARFQKLMTDYRRALTAKKGDADLEKIEKEAQPFAPEGFSFAEFKESMQINQLFTEYYRAATTGSEAKLKELTPKLEAVKTSNAEMLNNIAWTLLTDERIKNRDVKLALKMAKAANDASHGSKAHILDTYARALFENGQKAEAAKIQKKAIDLTTDPDQKAELERTLKKYSFAPLSAPGGVRVVVN